MLVRCLYASRSATTPIVAPVVESILVAARRNNPPRGITGLLCYSDTTFVQLLEGGRSEVNELFNVIVRDERHTGLQVLRFDETMHRDCGRWTMGRVGVGMASQTLLMKYYARAELDPFSAPSDATLALLTELATTGAISGSSK
jgi:hypothetical protein